MILIYVYRLEAYNPVGDSADAQQTATVAGPE
jgi:hypothetical protein